MSADHERLERLAHRFYAAWNAQDVEAVLDCYTDDVLYLDPNTRGYVQGREALRRYLTKLFDRWDMTWEGTEVFPLEGVDGSAARWRATLSPKGSDASVTVEGVDLVILEGDRMKRDEVYFDRAVLADVFTSGTVAPADR